MRNILVYGSFREPEKQQNFIVVRIPDGRCPWSKKIAPAIHRLVKPWIKDGSIYDWWSEGVEEHYWTIKTGVRYLWDGEKLVKQEEA